MIIMFHGAECPHCHTMMPLVEKLEKEGIKIEKKEVWHDEKNADEMRTHMEKIKEACQGELGTPVFYSDKTDSAICGEQSYKDLKKWTEDN